MPFVEVNGNPLFYALSRGPESGPAVVLIHGAGGSHVHWPAELRRLPGATVYALDLPGHGRSKGKGRDTVSGYAEAVVAFCDALGLTRPVVIGHSMGGAIAQTLALDFPDRISALVLVATGARLRVTAAILDGIVSNFDETVKLIASYLWSRESAPAVMMERLGVQVLRDTGPIVLRGDFVACDRFDVMSRLGEIAVPTLVIGGTADLLTPAKYAHFLAEHIPDARLRIFPDAGHVVMLEHPVEVAQAVQEFLEEIWTS